MKSGLDSDLESRPAGHLVERAFVVIEFEDIGHHTLDVDLATIEIGNSAREAVRLGERSNDLDLVTEDLHED